MWTILVSKVSFSTLHCCITFFFFSNIIVSFVMLLSLASADPGDFWRFLDRRGTSHRRGLRCEFKRRRWSDPIARSSIHWKSRCCGTPRSSWGTCQCQGWWMDHPTPSCLLCWKTCTFFIIIFACPSLLHVQDNVMLLIYPGQLVIYASK